MINLVKGGEIMNLLNSNGVSITYFKYTKRSDTFLLPLNEKPMSILDLTFCMEGELHYIYNGEHIILHPGDGIVILPGTFRERYETEMPVKYASINILFGKEQEFELDGYLPGIVDSRILYLLELIKKDFSVVSPNRNEKCLSAFSYIYNYICETVCNAENPHVKAIKQYVADNLKGDLSLGVLANHVHLAPQYICALFKKETGMTITNFILKARIDQAKMLILATNETILTIAEECGFSDYCYFSHAFKKITGISARQFRTENTK